MITKSRLNNLIKRAEELKADYIDFLSESNMKDGYTYGMLYNYSVENNTESLIQFCIDNDIKDLNSLLNFVAKDLFKT